jgi:hypothetical protein
MTYQVKNRFQNVPFKRNLQRYTMGLTDPVKMLQGAVRLGEGAVGLRMLESS